MRLEERTFGVQTTTRYRRKRYKQSRPKKWRYILVGICLFLSALCIGLSIIEYPVLDNRYHKDLALAYTGAQDLQTAAALMQTIPHDLFNTKLVVDARHNFTDALTTFTQLNNDLTSIPDVLTFIPIYGTRLYAAKHLVPLAMDVARAGLAGCTIVSTLTSRFHGPLNKGLTLSDITVLNQNLLQIEVILNQAIQQVDQLQPEDLQFDPRLGKMVSEFRSRLPVLEAFLSVAPTVFGIGKPAYYLVEMLDTAELRPGGGFIGNYGIATFLDGRLASAQVTDAILLDKGFGYTYRVPYPPAYLWFPLTREWGVRDSNLDADFPTSARNGEMLYELEAGKPPVAGVIALTPALIERMLTLTGPIAVPEYHETVTAQNFIDRILYHQIIEEGLAANVASPDGYSSVSKHFTALLGKHFVARLQTLPASLLPRLTQVLIDSMYTKDLQIYFTSAAAEKALQFYHLDDSVQSPAGDGIFVVDANITPSKANRYLVTTVNDQVTIDNAGTATHRTLIEFTWTTPGLTGLDILGPTLYQGYVRVYVPSHSVLLTQSGWDPHDSGAAFGRTFWGGYSHIPYPNAATITLVWRITGAAQTDAQHWHYSYLIQHQAGAQQNVHLQVALPSCAAITDMSTGVVADSKQYAHLAQALTQDTEASIDYTC